MVNDVKKEDLNGISKPVKLHPFHWAVVIFSLALTFFAWYFSNEQLKEKNKLTFTKEADHIVELITERMQKYEDGLWAGVSAITLRNHSIDNQDWETFANSQKINIKYPGINGIGIIYAISEKELGSFLKTQLKQNPKFNIFPKHEKKEYWPITYIEPLSTNFKAVGLDMAHEQNRFVAAKKSRDSGLAQITGPIVLVQDSEKTPGFLFYTPFYKIPDPKTLDEKRDNFIGLVYAPFVVKKLMKGTLEQERRYLNIRISDKKDVLYNELKNEFLNFDKNPLYRKIYNRPLYGRIWNFEIASNLAFRKSSSNSQPKLILIGGILIDSMLLMIFIILGRSNKKAILYANKVNEQLITQTADLEKSNQDLEKFAYITSHDLKTPLRGMSDLTEYIEEDLENYLADGQSNPEVKKNIERMKLQVKRMDNLIRGILEYSSIGYELDELESINLETIVNRIADDYDIEMSHFIFEGEKPHFFTDSTKLNQVFTNLITNAIKYHDKPENMLIKINIIEKEDFHEISVTDNGPGIDPKFHTRIFEVFQTLQTKDDVESTGIGLSIVKKIVEQYHGTITIESELGKGSKFTFLWPKEIKISAEA
jgi:signal transduction histidine kinase